LAPKWKEKIKLEIMRIEHNGEYVSGSKKINYMGNGKKEIYSTKFN
jgi:hypothetical protein